MRRRSKRSRQAALIGALGLLLLPLQSVAAPPDVGPLPVTVTAKVCDGATPPTILAPPDNTTTLVASTTLVGTGNADETITVYRNGLIAGSATTDATGNWTINITLVGGTNLIVAENCVGQAGITITYNAPIVPTPPPSPAPPPTQPTPAAPPPTTAPLAPLPKPPAGQLPPPSGRPTPPGLSGPIASLPPGRPPTVSPNDFILTTSQSVLSALAGETVLLYFSVHNGGGPYNMQIDWGDGSSEGQLIREAGDVTLGHRYRHGGTYNVKLRLTDRYGRVSTMSYVVKVEGPNSPLVPQGTRQSSTLLWLLLGEGLMLLLIFVLWEYYHQRKLNAALE